MDAETIAGLLAVGDRQLRNYCKLGCPFDTRGRERLFNWPAVLAWYVTFKGGGVPVDGPDDEADEEAPGPGKKETLTQATLRKTKAEANLKELMLSRQRGQVIDIATAKRLIDRLFGNLKSALLSAAPMLNTRLEGEPDSTSREAAIRTYMEDLCRELATGKIVGADVEEEATTSDDEPDTIDELEAAASEVTLEDIDQAVVEFVTASAALEEVEHAV